VKSWLVNLLSYLIFVGHIVIDMLSLMSTVDVIMMS
jgi:hypothetical protein